jgi:hypothetical protein
MGYENLKTAESASSGCLEKYRGKMTPAWIGFFGVAILGGFSFGAT